MRFDRAVRRISRIFMSAAAAVLTAMMFLMVADVFCRYMLNRPILGAFELTELMMAILVFFSLAYTHLRKKHISVDVFVIVLPKRTQQILQAFGSLLGLGLFSLMTWQIVLYALRLYRVHQRSIDLGLPLFPFLLAAALGATVFCLVLLTGFLSALAGRGDE